jgi:uncharacterized protein (DUF58 family)
MTLTDSREAMLSPDFMARLDRLDLVSRKILAGRMKGERRSKRRGQSVEFADYRNYVIGDDLRFIDWNIYGRLDKLFLKLFLDEEDLALHILIDRSASMNYGEPNKLDYARRVAAAIAYVGLVNYNRVSVSAFSEGEVAGTGPLRSRRRVAAMLDFVSGLAPAGPGDFPAAARRFALSQRGKGVLVVLGDFFEKAGVDAGLRFLATGRYDLFVLQVLSPQEIRPTLAGDLKLQDVEDDDTAEVSVSAALLARYENNLKAYCASVREYVTRRNGVYLMSPTNVPFEQLVLNYLRERRLLA